MGFVWPVSLDSYLTIIFWHGKPEPKKETKAKFHKPCVSHPFVCLKAAYRVIRIAFHSFCLEILSSLLQACRDNQMYALRFSSKTTFHFSVKLHLGPVVKESQGFSWMQNFVAQKDKTWYLDLTPDQKRGLGFAPDS